MKNKESSKFIETIYIDNYGEDYITEIINYLKENPLPKNE